MITETIKEFVKQTLESKLLYLVIIILLSIINFIGYQRFDEVKSNIDTKIQKKIDNKMKEITEETLRKSMHRTLSSFRLHQSLNSYIKSYDEYKKDQRKRSVRIKDLLNEINTYLDDGEEGKYSSSEVQQAILDNQSNMLGFYPYLLEDLIYMKDFPEFSKECHIAFWILYKSIKYSSEKIRLDIKNSLIDSSKKTRINDIYCECSKYGDLEKLNQAWDQLKEHIKSVQIKCK